MFSAKRAAGRLKGLWADGVARFSSAAVDAQADQDGA